MSNRLLDFADYIGGPDTIVIEMFPRMQRKYVYNFGGNISSYQFSADFQTLVLGNMSYDRATGNPNFSTTTILGSFPTVSNVSNALITVTDASAGVVELVIPENRYTGNIIPNARANVPATVLTFQWSVNNTTGAVKDAHRYLILERYEPGVPIGDPTEEVTFVPLTLS